jgi:hypothetical protein
LPSLNWTVIANAQLEAGKKSDEETQTTFDNSFRGLPFKRREVSKDDFEKLKQRHCWTPTEAPTLDNVEMIFVVCDTQDDRSVCGVFALSTDDNLFLIEAQELQHLMLTEDERTNINELRKQEAARTGVEYTPIITVEDMLNKEYLVREGKGIVPTFCLMDRQGHRTGEVQYFADHHSNVMMYQGAALKESNWKMSDTNKKLLLATAKHWQTKLIYQLYTQKKRDQNYLFFTPEITNEVIKQIVVVKPDNSKKYGDDPSNWLPENGAQHDWFDVCKMAYLAVDFAIQTMSRKRWRFCQSPALKRRWERVVNAENRQKQSSINTDQILDSKQKWFKG